MVYGPTARTREKRVVVGDSTVLFSLLFYADFVTGADRLNAH